jgi:hypothetical protein
MPDAPLSRRARRTFEEEAADRAALQESTSTTAQELTSGELSAIEHERDAAFSRRDRRRMERLNHPLEAWTAEEEMLATGQIPAMTPERIAEQERISREKAARAAEEATAASQEFRRLAQADVRRAPAPAPRVTAFQAPAAQPQVFQAPAAQASVFTAPAGPAPEVQVPVFQAPATQPQWAEEPAIDVAEPFEFASTPVWPEEPASDAPHPAAPTAPSFDTNVSPQPVHDAPDTGDIQAGDIHAGDIHAGGVYAADPRAGRPVVEAYQPIMALDDAPPLHVVHPVHDVRPVNDEAQEHDEAPVEAQQGADEQPLMRSNVFDALFPPGSSQAALRQQDPFATSLTQEPAPTASGQIPTLLPPQEVPERAINPVDEIRRLAAEAMSGIERASKADEEAAAAAAARAAAAAAASAAGPSADPSARAEVDSVPRASAPPSRSLQDGAPYNAAPYNAAPANAAPYNAAPYNAAPANAAPANAAPDDAAPYDAAPTNAAPTNEAPNGGSPAAARPLDNFSWDEVVSGSPSASQDGTSAPVDSIGEWSRSAEHAPATPYGGMTPQHTGFDQLTQPYSGSAYGSAPASGQFAMPGQQGQPASGQFPMPGQQGQPAPQGLGGPQGPAWSSQPLHTEPPRPAEAQAFTPLSNVPKPDFSGLYQQGSPSAFPPLTGAINTAALNAAEFHGGDMSASGQGTGIRRPELPEVGGAKHFKWLHLSVIGALMFVLGVVIYNVAFSK